MPFCTDSSFRGRVSGTLGIFPRDRWWTNWADCFLYVPTCSQADKKVKCKWARDGNLDCNRGPWRNLGMPPPGHLPRKRSHLYDYLIFHLVESQQVLTNMFVFWYSSYRCDHQVLISKYLWFVLFFTHLVSLRIPSYPYFLAFLFYLHHPNLWEDLFHWEIHWVSRHQPSSFSFCLSFCQTSSFSW